MPDNPIDFDGYVPVVLSTFVDKLRAASASFFRERFGITVLEWRILAFLTDQAPCTGYRIWNGINADKAAVSRAVRCLQKEGLVHIRDVPGGRTRTAISLTDQGRALYGASVPEVRARHERLVAGLADQDLSTLIRAVRHLEKRIPAMAGDDREAAPR